MSVNHCLEDTGLEITANHSSEINCIRSVKKQSCQSSRSARNKLHYYLKYTLGDMQKALIYLK